VPRRGPYGAGPSLLGVTATTGWTRVVLRVPTLDAELAADRLWAFGPAAIEERSHPEGTVLLAGFADGGVAAMALAAVEGAGLGDGALVPVDDDGLDGWRPWAGVVRADPFVIVPTWLEVPEVAAGERLVRVDPWHTFGSGSHPTTRLVLRRLAELVRSGDTVLDVGCGSGILGIGAALLGAHEVLGIDVDPGAPAATAANAASNGVERLVAAATTPLAAVAERVADGASAPFDLVVANLLAPILVELATDLVRVVAPDGALVVSGLLADRWAATTDHLTGLDVADVRTDDGWAAITLVPPGA
jgi:ribosomal protein L11 methyltransferase